MMLIFLHGSIGIWDEVLLFGGLAVVIVGLMLLPRLSALMRNNRTTTNRSSKRDENKRNTTDENLEE